jgi:elongation factor G
VTLTDGAAHEVDSSLLAFDIATRAALREGLPGAEPLLLEPVMRVEVVTPPDLLVDLLADLNARRGEITGQGERGSAALVHALVPLASLFGYSRALKELARGRAGFSMQFSHYAPVPPGDDPRFSPAIGRRA